ncbi:hypothetical protein [Herbaspirillum seropedicae]|uniref:hypothetical protein n=1 Tax=Herbaspirillum seropedicae TaxID=964 RepID=UPI002862F7E0|nr:hypothetical protein [Herbaspirillum seropedicae]MDR6395897.1 hypothetical protein [Herbaspirillum seropedicae]
MLLKIIEELKKNPGIKAKTVAKALAAQTSDVNSILHHHPEHFVQDENFCWTVKHLPLVITFPEDAWLDGDRFEAALLEATCPASHSNKSVTFVLPSGCKILLIAAARLMALCNQLVTVHRKKVTLQFTEKKNTMQYLNRMGFFSQLHPDVVVTPERPEDVKTLYHGQNANVVEFANIDPKATKEEILRDTTPDRLSNAFATHIEPRFLGPLFTLIAELINNVRDHSRSELHGFVASQAYGLKGPSRRHIQTVISDSGKGIPATLNPILDERYPEIAAKIASLGNKRDAGLVTEIFRKNGRISSISEERGIGFQVTGEFAKKFNALVEIRQESFELTLRYTDGILKSRRVRLGLARLLGTHICVDFDLD